MLHSLKNTLEFSNILQKTPLTNYTYTIKCYFMYFKYIAIMLRY